MGETQTLWVDNRVKADRTSSVLGGAVKGLSVREFWEEREKEKIRRYGGKKESETALGRWKRAGGGIKCS